MTAALASTPMFSALDRCDRCGAQARVRATLAGGGDLLFCGHHARLHADALAAVALTVEGDSAL
jgi:hypothetical protein